MKFCSRPYNHIYVSKAGISRCCSWAGKLPIGDLSKNTLDEIWNSDAATALKESVADQSYQYCSKISCPFLSNNSLPEVSADEFKKLEKKYKNSPPTEFNLAYDFTCNHICPSCRDSKFVATKEYKQLMGKIEAELLPQLKHATLIMASGNGDVFSSKYMLGLLSKIKPENKDCWIKLETNGSLVKRNWPKVRHLEKYNMSVVVTPNSYEEKTYTLLSGGKENLEMTLDSLRYLSYLRKEERIKEFKITMVIQPENFREVPSFIERSLNEFNPDVIQLRPIMQWFQMTPEKYKKQNLMDLTHPNHREFIEIMQHPICEHPKVYHWIGKNY